MVHKSSPEHEHAKMFAPIFIGIGIGLAIFGSMPLFLGSNLPVSNAMNTAPTNYAECMQLPKSRVLKSYPPVCITPEGEKFEKPLPRIMRSDY